MAAQINYAHVWNTCRKRVDNIPDAYMWYSDDQFEKGLNPFKEAALLDHPLCEGFLAEEAAARYMQLSKASAGPDPIRKRAKRTAGVRLPQVKPKRKTAKAAPAAATRAAAPARIATAAPAVVYDASEHPQHTTSARRKRFRVSRSSSASSSPSISSIGHDPTPPSPAAQAGELSTGSAEVAGPEGAASGDAAAAERAPPSGSPATAPGNPALDARIEEAGWFRSLLPEWAGGGATAASSRTSGSQAGHPSSAFTPAPGPAVPAAAHSAGTAPRGTPAAAAAPGHGGEARSAPPAPPTSRRKPIETAVRLMEEGVSSVLKDWVLSKLPYSIGKWMAKTDVVAHQAPPPDPKIISGDEAARLLKRQNQAAHAERKRQRVELQQQKAGAAAAQVAEKRALAAYKVAEARDRKARELARVAAESAEQCSPPASPWPADSQQAAEQLAQHRTPQAAPQPPPLEQAADLPAHQPSAETADADSNHPVLAMPQPPRTSGKRPSPLPQLGVDDNKPAQPAHQHSAADADRTLPVKPKPPTPSAIKKPDVPTAEDLWLGSLWFRKRARVGAPEHRLLYPSDPSTRFLAMPQPPRTSRKRPSPLPQLRVDDSKPAQPWPPLTGSQQQDGGAGRSALRAPPAADDPGRVRTVASWILNLCRAAPPWVCLLALQLQRSWTDT